MNLDDSNTRATTGRPGPDLPATGEQLDELDPDRDPNEPHF